MTRTVYILEVWYEGARQAPSQHACSPACSIARLRLTTHTTTEALAETAQLVRLLVRRGRVLTRCILTERIYQQDTPVRTLLDVSTES